MNSDHYFGRRLAELINPQTIASHFTVSLPYVDSWIWWGKRTDHRRIQTLVLNCDAYNFEL